MLIQLVRLFHQFEVLDLTALFGPILCLPTRRPLRQDVYPELTIRKYLDLFWARVSEGGYQRLSLHTDICRGEFVPYHKRFHVFDYRKSTWSWVGAAAAVGIVNRHGLILPEPKSSLAGTGAFCLAARADSLIVFDGHRVGGHVVATISRTDDLDRVIDSWLGTVRIRR